MGAKQNFNLGGINSHFNGLKDAGNMSPTQLALTYSKEQLQHMAQMGVINPTNAVIAGMNIDRISTANAPPTSTVSQDTLAPQQPQSPQQGQLPQQPPQGQPPQQGGIMSIPRPGQKYQHGGVVAFSNEGEVKAPIIYDEDAEFAAFKKAIAGHSVSEKERGIDSSPNITDENLRPINDYTPTISPSRDPRLLREIYGKGGEPSAVGRPGVTSLTQLPAQSARPGAGAGNPPAASVLSNVDPAFLAMLKERGGQPMMAHENVQEGSNDALNRALIRGGAAMMANRDPAIGSGLQGFLQTAGKGATEGLTGYEQQIREFKDRQVKQDELRATENYRTRANKIAAASTGVTYGLEKDRADALPIAAKLKREGEVDVAQISANARSLGNNISPLDVLMNPNSTQEMKDAAREIAGLGKVKTPQDVRIAASTLLSKNGEYVMLSTSDKPAERARAAKMLSNMEAYILTGDMGGGKGEVNKSNPLLTGK